MQIKQARQILKSLADDTRLRIINLLNNKQLSVTEICKILDQNQSNISKHLSRLRLTGIVFDKRKGLNVYYCLIKSDNKAHRQLLKSITVGLADLEVFQKDLEKLEQIKPSRKKNTK